MNNRQATLRDIAHKLGLSPSTVSRALRDHPDVGLETRERVKALAKQLDYHPNSLAQSLQKKRTKTIGVIVPEIRHYFFSSAISGIDDVAYNHGYTIIVSQSNENYEREVINTSSMISHRIAGLVVSIAQTTRNSEHFLLLQRRGVPLVFFDRVCEDVDASKVVVDDHDGAFKAVEHLINRGYKRIAHLSGSEHLNIARLRLQGYKDALQKYHIEIDERMIVPGGLHEIDGEAGCETLLRLAEPPDAIFAINDPVAIGAYRCLKANRIRIPEEMGVVGFSDNPSASFVEPTLTTIAQPGYEMGKLAAQILIEAIENPDATPTRTKVLKTELIARESTRSDIKDITEAPTRST